MEEVNDNRSWYRNEYLKSDHWKALRKQALDASPRCAACLKDGPREPHHMAYRQIYNVRMDDLIVLCRKCHLVAHEIIDRGIVPHPSSVTGSARWIGKLLTKCIQLKREIPFSPIVTRKVVMSDGSVKKKKVVSDTGRNTENGKAMFTKVMSVLSLSKDECSYCIRLLTEMRGGESFRLIRKHASINEMIEVLGPAVAFAKMRGFSEPIRAARLPEATYDLISQITAREKPTIAVVRKYLSPTPSKPRVEKDYERIKDALSISADELTKKMLSLKQRLGDEFSGFKRLATTDDMIEALRVA